MIFCGNTILLCRGLRKTLTHLNILIILPALQLSLPAATLGTCNISIAHCMLVITNNNFGQEAYRCHHFTMSLMYAVIMCVEDVVWFSFKLWHLTLFWSVMSLTWHSTSVTLLVINESFQYTCEAYVYFIVKWIMAVFLCAMSLCHFWARTWCWKL